LCLNLREGRQAGGDVYLNLDDDPFQPDRGATHYFS